MLLTVGIPLTYIAVIKLFFMKRNELERNDLATYGVAFVALVAAVIVCFFLFNK
jgi:hypothetical protein